MAVDFDLNKARIFLAYISTANKRINDRREAFKKIHEEIKEIKKSSSKTARSRISKLEDNIISALKQGGFIIEEQPAVEEQLIMPSKKLREEKLKEIESVAVEKSALKSLKSIEISEIENILRNLEKMKKGIKAVSSEEKER